MTDTISTDYYYKQAEDLAQAYVVLNRHIPASERDNLSAHIEKSLDKVFVDYARTDSAASAAELCAQYKGSSGFSRVKNYFELQFSFFSALGKAPVSARNDHQFILLLEQAQEVSGEEMDEVYTYADSFHSTLGFTSLRTSSETFIKYHNTLNKYLFKAVPAPNVPDQVLKCYQTAVHSIFAAAAEQLFPHESKKVAFHGFIGENFFIRELTDIISHASINGMSIKQIKEAQKS